MKERGDLVQAVPVNSVLANEDSRMGQSRLAWLVCFVGSLFFFYEFIQMNMFNAINTHLMRDFNLDASELGSLSATYFLANVAFLLPAGIILDRFSTRKVMLISLSICVLGTFLFGLVESTALAALCRFFTGIGSAFCFLSNVRLATRWFPAQRIALVTGLIVTMAMIGGMVAQAPLTYLVDAVGWRKALFIDAGLGVIVIALIAFIVRDYPSHYHAQAADDKVALTKIGFLSTAKLAFLNYRNWLCGIYTCLMNLPIFILGGFMGTMFLSNVHHIDHTRASFVTMMIFLGTIFGSPLVGWLSDRIGLRKPPMIIGAILSILTVLILIYAENVSMGTLMLCFFLLGLFTSSQVISYPVVSESNSRLLTAMCVSCVSLTTIGGGALFEPVFGWLMDYHWNGVMADGVPLFTAGDYQFAMLLFPIGFAVSLATTYFIRETHCKTEQ
jgi:MFS family permease